MGDRLLFTPEGSFCSGCRFLAYLSRNEPKALENHPYCTMYHEFLAPKNDVVIKHPECGQSSRGILIDDKGRVLEQINRSNG